MALQFRIKLHCANNDVNISYLEFFTEGNSVTPSQSKVPSSPIQNLAEAKIVGKLVNILLTTTTFNFVLYSNDQNSILFNLLKLYILF